MSRIIRTYDPDIGPLVRVTVTDPFSSRPEHELPRSEIVTLLLDTGATDTALRGNIIDRLRLSPLGFHSVHSFGPDPATSVQYSADLEIHLDGDALKEFADWKVFRFAPSYDKIDGVIGRDILQKARFSLDGPKCEFVLEF